MNNSLTLVQLKKSDQVTYLKQAYQIESALYEAQTWENKLIQEKRDNEYWLSKNQEGINSSRDHLKEKDDFIKNSKPWDGITEDVVPTFFVALMWIGPVWIVGVLLVAFWFNLGETNPTLGEFLWNYGLLGVPLGCAILASLFVMKSNSNHRRKELEKINLEKNKINQQIADYEQKIDENKKVISSCTNEIPLAHKEVKKLEAIKKQFYSYRFLHPNYQGLIAISQLLTYFSTGQCFTLYGPNGACRLYEEDLLQKKIIGKLDQVISLLEEIKENQILLYNAIERANSTAKNNMKLMEKSLNSLQREASLTNYYNQKIYEEEKFQSEMLMWNSFK